MHNTDNFIPEQGPTPTLDVHYVLLLHNSTGWQMESCSKDLNELMMAHQYFSKCLADIKNSVVSLTEAQIGD